MRVTDPVVNQFLEPDHEFDFNPVNRNLCFGGGKPSFISAAQAEADRARKKIEAEAARAKKISTDKVKTALEEKGTSLQDLIKKSVQDTISGVQKTVEQTPTQTITDVGDANAFRERMIRSSSSNPFGGGRDYARDLRQARDRYTPNTKQFEEADITKNITPNVDQFKQADITKNITPNVDQFKEADIIKNITPNLDQDLTRANNQTIQNAAINAASDVQAAAQKLGTDTQKEAISTASDVQAAATKAATDVQKETILTGGNIQAAATKAGSDIQEAAVKAGSDVQAGVSDIVNQTGIRNETLEKIISSNVKGTEASLDTAVKGAEAEISKNVKGTEASLNTAVKGLEGEIAKNVAGGKGTLQTIVKGAEAELEKNVNGLEGTIEDFTKSIEEIGTILTQPFQKETESTDEPADTTVSPVEDTSSNPPPGPGEVLTDEMTAQERKSRNRLLQASRYGRQRTILTGGSGISGYGY